MVLRPQVAALEAVPAVVLRCSCFVEHLQNSNSALAAAEGLAMASKDHLRSSAMAHYEDLLSELDQAWQSSFQPAFLDVFDLGPA